MLDLDRKLQPPAVNSGKSPRQRATKHEDCDSLCIINKGSQERLRRLDEINQHPTLPTPCSSQRRQFPSLSQFTTIDSPVSNRLSLHQTSRCCHLRQHWLPSTNCPPWIIHKRRPVNTGLARPRRQTLLYFKIQAIFRPHLRPPSRKPSNHKPISVRTSIT